MSEITVKLDVKKARKWLMGEGQDDYVYERIAQADEEYRKEEKDWHDRDVENEASRR